MFSLWQIATRNIGRNRRRTLLTASAVAFAVAILVFIMSYFRGVTADVFNTVIQLQTGHCRITAPGLLEREILHPLTPSIPNVTMLCDSLETLPEIEVATPRINFWGFIETGDISRVEPNAGIAVDFTREDAILHPKEILVQGRIPEQGSLEIFLGERLRQELKVDIGDTLWIWTSTSRRGLYALDLVVSGSFQTGINPVDERTFVIPIKTAWELLDMEGSATEVLLMTDDLWNAETLRPIVQTRFSTWHNITLTVTPWTDQGGIVQALRQVSSFIIIIIVIFMIIAASTITNTMLMAVLERNKEIGMMKALGVHNRSIVFLVVTEAIVIGLLGGAAGGILGTGVSIWTEAVGIQLGDAMADIDMPIGQALFPDFRWSYLAIGWVLGMFFSGLAALYPAWKASQFPAAVTMRAT